MKQSKIIENDFDSFWAPNRLTKWSENMINGNIEFLIQFKSVKFKMTLFTKRSCLKCLVMTAN
jgi:hypothetical protein